MERKESGKWDAKEREKRKEISAIQQNPFSGEERGMEGGLEGQTDGEATKKGKAGERKRLPFLSPDEKPRGLRGARDNREGRRRRGKKEGCD